VPKELPLQATAEDSDGSDNDMLRQTVQNASSGDRKGSVANS